MQGAGGDNNNLTLSLQVNAGLKWGFCNAIRAAAQFTTNHLTNSAYGAPEGLGPGEGCPLCPLGNSTFCDCLALPTEV